MPYYFISLHYILRHKRNVEGELSELKGSSNINKHSRHTIISNENISTKRPD